MRRSPRAAPLEQDGGIARLVLDAPPRNEMDQGFFRTLAALVGTLKDLPVRGLVVHGAGRHFSSGADVDALKAGLAGAQPALAARALLAATSSFQAIARAAVPDRGGRRRLLSRQRPRARAGLPLAGRRRERGLRASRRRRST